MRNNRWVWVGVYLVATAVLAAGVIVLIRDRDTSEAAALDAAPQLAPMPFASDLTPAGPTQVKVGDSVPFDAQGFTDRPVASVELWDGPTLIETQDTAGTSGAVVSLPALSVGQHAVYAKVTDEDGKESLTAPIPVDVVANGTEPVAPVEVAPEEGETVEQLAKRLDVDIDRISVMAGGEQVVPIDEIAPLQLQPDDVIPVGAIVGAQPDGDAGIEQATSPDPIAPKGGGTSSGELALSAKASECSITLTVDGADGQVLIYEAAGGGAGFRKVGERDGSGSVDLPVVTPGVHLFMAYEGTLKTAPLQVTMPPGCSKASGWTGDVFITDGILTTPNGVSSGGHWLYLQADGGTAVRVPATGYLPSIGLYTNIGSLLPPMSGAELDVELWRGTEFNDELVGKGHLDAPEGSSIGSVIGGGRQVLLDLTNPAGSEAILDTQDRKLTFTWTAGPQIEAVLYQVLVDDVPVTQTTVPAEQILASGVSVRSGAGTAGSGTFTIDTKDIPGRAATGREATEGVTPSYPVTAQEAIGTTITSSKKPAFITPIGPKTVDRESEAPVLIDLPTYGDDVYVRAIGLVAGSGSRSPSQTIRVQLPVPEGIDGKRVTFVPGDDFGDPIYTPGHLSIRSFETCVWADVGWNGPVARKPYTSPSPMTLRIEAMSAAYPTDGTYCPSDFPPPPPPPDDDCAIAQIFCDAWAGIVEFGGALVTAFEAVYTFATTIVDTVVSKIASTIATYSGVCDALEGVASGSKKTCGAVLEMATKAVISAVLVSVGIPPALPDPGILAAIAKGDFAAVAVTLMEVAGIPCSSFKPDPDVAAAMGKAAQLSTGASKVVAVAQDPCLAMASALVATVKSQVISKSQQTIAQSTGLPYAPISHNIYDLKLTPSPLGQNSLSRVKLRMQPKDDNAAASGVSCPVTVRIVNVLDDGKRKTVSAAQVVRVDELPAPNKGRWERDLILTTTGARQNLVYGTWQFEAFAANEVCTLQTIEIADGPATLPNYAKDRKKGQPTVEAARPAA